MATDIIADNQTAAAIARLRRGEADDALRDEVQAATLSTMQEMLVEISEIKKNIWSIDTIKGIIDERQSSHCLTCPTKRWVDGEIARVKAGTVSKPTGQGFLSRVLESESIRYFIIVVILVWAIIYIRTGVDGLNAIKSGVTHTMTGGVK